MAKKRQIVTQKSSGDSSRSCLLIKFEYINPNYKVRLKSSTLLEVAKAELIKEPH